MGDVNDVKGQHFECVHRLLGQLIQLMVHMVDILHLRHHHHRVHCLVVHNVVAGDFRRRRHECGHKDCWPRRTILEEEEVVNDDEVGQLVVMLAAVVLGDLFHYFHNFQPVKGVSKAVIQYEAPRGKVVEVIHLDTEGYFHLNDHSVVLNMALELVVVLDVDNLAVHSNFRERMQQER